MSQQKRTDWRGQPIEVGTKVIYHRSYSGIATWGLGTVTRLHRDGYGRGLIDIEWEQHTANSKRAHGVSVDHVTVWPVQSAGSLKSQLTEFTEISDYLDDQVIH